MNFRSRLELAMKTLPPPDPEQVAIVGGGIAGLLLASKLKVPRLILFERFRKAGMRRHCTGILSVETAERCLVRREHIMNVYRSIVLIVPSIRLEVTLRCDKAFALKIDREAHEVYLAELAEQRGHDLKFGCEVVNAKVNRYNGKATLRVNCRDGASRTYNADLIIIAEGYPPRLAGIFALSSKSVALTGLQRVAVLGRRLRNDSVHTLYVIIDPWILEGGFGWVAPLSDRKILVGVATRRRGTKARELLGVLLRAISRHLGDVTAGNGGVFGGVVLRGYPKRLINEYAFGIGDAVTAVKSMSGGGLYAISRLADLYTRFICSKDLWVLKAIEELRKELWIQYYLANAVYRALRLLAQSRIAFGMRIEVFLRELDYDHHERLLLDVLSSKFSVMRTIGAECVMRRRSTEGL